MGRDVDSSAFTEAGILVRTAFRLSSFFRHLAFLNRHLLFAHLILNQILK